MNCCKLQADFSLWLVSVLLSGSSLCTASHYRWTWHVVFGMCFAEMERRALFRTGLGILRLYQDVLLQMDFIHSAQFLSRLPENTPAHTLFSCIANTQMISNNRRWNQVWNTHIYNCERLVLIKCVFMCICICMYIYNIYVCVYICMYVCVCVCVYIYISGGPLSALTCCVNVRLLSGDKKNIAVNLFSKLGWELGLYYASYDDFHPDILARMYT